ncbi:hypothetical protein C8R45DRAFT_484423 [Mycena sanguinolenta]|nr:hypothetical protein C8R45DRAFT_484423 [Mycena sanguinolenta]
MSGLSLVRRYEQAPSTLEDTGAYIDPAFVVHLNKPGSELDIPHTERLLRSVARSIQDLTTGADVSLAFRTALMAIDYALERQHQDHPSLSDTQFSHSITEYTASRTLETWFTLDLDKPRTGRVEWGMMNMNRKKESRLGFGVPTINANLASQFEQIPKSPRRRQHEGGAGILERPHRRDISPRVISRMGAGGLQGHASRGLDCPAAAWRVQHIVGCQPHGRRASRPLG